MKQARRWKEAMLIRQCLAGDKESFGLLIGDYQPKLFAVALRMIGQNEDAQDLVQETLVRAYLGLPGYRFAYAFSTWLYRILINSCLNFLAKNKPCLAELAHLESQQPPMSAIERQEFWQQVELALRQLPALERSAFVLATFEKLSVAEIAAILEKPRGTICWYLYRARKKLQELLRE